jgi:hypothetical protein
MEIDELWTVKDIAAFGKWAPTYTANVIVCLPQFPKPIRVTGENAKPRWVSNQVKAFIASLAS